jgi:hypothetical protein
MPVRSVTSARAQSPGFARGFQFLQHRFQVVETSRALVMARDEVGQFSGHVGAYRCIFCAFFGCQAPLTRDPFDRHVQCLLGTS